MGPTASMVAATIQAQRTLHAPTTKDLRDATSTLLGLVADVRSQERGADERLAHIARHLGGMERLALRLAAVAKAAPHGEHQDG